MKVMAIDYGDARTGVAVSDATASLTGAAWVIHVHKQETVASMIASEAAGRGVGVIVVGYPINMNGSAGPRAAMSERLAGLLRKLCDIEVVLWDERMTTISAHRILTDVGKHGKKRKENVDAVAASVILEGYLNSLKKM